MTDQLPVNPPKHFFSEDYIERCFQTWYLSGRAVSIPKIIEILEPDEAGHKPSKEAIIAWRRKFDWEMRANELDARAIEIADDFLIQKKADMLRRHAQAASELADKALNHLMEHGFDTSAAAVHAYFRGTEEERLTRGISDMIIKMSKMRDDELRDKIAQLVDRANENNQIVDGEQVDIVSGEEDKGSA